MRVMKGNVRVIVLRLGHRPDRDKRITTHVALVARAFGADGILISTRDENVENSIKKVVERWGGPFDIKSGISVKKIIKDWKNKGGVIVHLTMYGIPLNEALKRIPRDRNLMIIVGAEKVPRYIYEVADYNVSVGNQPHSEVAALAVFLDRYFEGKELYKEFKGAKVKVIPQERGKKVIRLDKAERGDNDVQ